MTISQVAPPSRHGDALSPHDGSTPLASMPHAVRASSSRNQRIASRTMHRPSTVPLRKPRPSVDTKQTAETALPVRRKRLSGPERETQIVAGAVRFFSDRGLDGQLRDLARNIGVTHALLYHYFPTKQALIDRVYVELFEGLWQPAWDRLLDDRTLDAETRFTRFYCAYARAIFSRDFVRIMIFSGLSDHAIPDRFFALLRSRLFPRLIRVTRRHCGVVGRGKPTARELEFMMGLHGGIFYIGLRRWVYEQPVHGAEAAEHDDAYITDRVRSYLLSARAVLYAPPVAPRKTRRT